MPASIAAGGGGAARARLVPLGSHSSRKRLKTAPFSSGRDTT
ncbi:hypothetical protein [Acidimangrovimonas pyrenivorans]|uniref:Uncharacterized protein n=1 Tax=Acidimangrovimonas pyrenivorans TaxID=2030798 RepID=A0ABV7AHU4_9RHOB